MYQEGKGEGVRGTVFGAQIPSPDVGTSSIGYCLIQTSSFSPFIPYSLPPSDSFLRHEPRSRHGVSLHSSKTCSDQSLQDPPLTHAFCQPSVSVGRLRT